MRKLIAIRNVITLCIALILLASDAGIAHRKPDVALGTFRGRVLNAANMSIAIPFAAIEFHSLADPTLIYTTQADAWGHYAISLPSGNYEAIVSAPLYQTYSTFSEPGWIVMPSYGGFQTVNFFLQPA